MARRTSVLVLTMAWAMGVGAARAQEQQRRKAADHATVEEERAQQRTTDNGQRTKAIAWPGLTREGAVLLPNGWSLKPAGRQVKLGDLPVQIAPHPGQPILAILHAGYGEHEVVTLDAVRGHVIGRVAIPGTFAGLAWSADGRQLFVGGGFDDVIYRFDHADGLLSNKAVFEYPDRKEFLAERNPESGERVRKHQRTPAGLAITKDGKTLYVSAVFGHSLGRFDAQSGAFLGEVQLPADSYAYGLALDESRGRIYVSLWSKAAVAVVDTASFQVIGTWPTRSIPTRCCSHGAGRPSMWPTPTATRSR
jgi:DNA-binding beta-propeller fold protein YncE